MSWARYDDMLPMNKKWASLRAHGTDGAAALGLHLLANTYSRHNGTGGVVDKHVVEMLVGKCGSKLARLLVEVGMFDVESDGWKIHDFAEYHDPSDPNPDRSANDRQKEISRSRAEAGRKGGLAKASKATDLPEAKSWQTPSPVPVPDPIKTTPQPPGGGGVHPKQVAREAAELLLNHETNVTRTGAWLATVTERLLNAYDCSTLTAQQIHDLEHPTTTSSRNPEAELHSARRFGASVKDMHWRDVPADLRDEYRTSFVNELPYEGREATDPAAWAAAALEAYDAHTPTVGLRAV